MQDHYTPDVYIVKKDTKVDLKDFINKELVQYSHADVVRSIPSVVDGLKPSQRKVLYSCFKRRLTQEMKVAQLAGYCAEHTAYHHGEQSLHATIINMAQDYVGSNNLPLLFPSGQFGTRLQGGKDAASPRYIFTRLNEVTRLIFPESDDSLLSYKEDDGQVVEPEFFIPVVPLVLINGAHGIGTGWSTYIPPHHPIQVIDALESHLSKKRELGELEPWVKGFQGGIQKSGQTTYMTSGVAVKKAKGVVDIVELPYGMWTSDFKDRLTKMLEEGEVMEIHGCVDA